MIQVIVFSKNRPLQLHGYLTSLFKHWKGEVQVSVLMRDESPYYGGYEDVRREFCDRVGFFTETDFPTNLKHILGRGPLLDLVCFGCDDAVYVAPVDVDVLETAFIKPDLLGVSMRMGRTISRGMFGDPMPQPTFVPAKVFNDFDEDWGDGPSLAWDVHSAPANTDWAYPWELIGTVYDGDFVRSMVNMLVEAKACPSPNMLEFQGANNWSRLTSRHLMRAYPTPRLVLSAVNVVQTDFPNGIVGDAELTPEYLLDLWNKGIRLDVDEFAHRAKKLDTWRIGNLWLSRQKVAA